MVTVGLTFFVPQISLMLLLFSLFCVGINHYWNMAEISWLTLITSQSPAGQSFIYTKKLIDCALAYRKLVRRVVFLSYIVSATALENQHSFGVQFSCKNRGMCPLIISTSVYCSNQSGGKGNALCSLFNFLAEISPLE